VTFQPGNDLGGRTKGSRNKRDAELWHRLEARGDKDPAELLSEIVSDEAESKELRAQAANWLLPFKYAKRGAVPQPPDPTFWNVEVRIQKATSVSQARENLQFISDLKLEGRISEQQSDSLFAEHGKILDALVDEAKLAAQDPGAEQIIQITGGLPPLPGTDVIMPSMNGHAGPALEGIPGPSPDPAPQSQDQEP
jgi:hypothetical protein